MLHNCRNWSKSQWVNDSSKGIDETKSAGANAVKFQTFKAERLSKKILLK